MSNRKICVYAICKNEEKFVERWMDSVSEADLVIVTDTGSSDGTVARLQARGALVFVERVVPWRFDEARNRALSHIPDDVDICVSSDLDEVFEPGWRRKLESAWRTEHTRARYTFVWSHDRNGNIDVQFPMEKIHARRGYRWVRAVHEELACEQIENKLHIPDLILHHYPDDSKSRSQYLPLMELAVNEDPHDAQLCFWLGREYGYHRQYDNAIRTMKTYLGLPGATWDEERSAAMRYIASYYREQNDTESWREWMWRAIAECPHVREPYLAMAEWGYSVQDWELTALMVGEGLKIKHLTSSYLTNSAAWKESLYDYGAISCYWLGQYGLSWQYAVEACRMNPAEERLQNNLALIGRKFHSLADGRKS